MLRLREIRKSRNTTMKKLGSELGLAESTISLYEAGKRQPDFETVLKLADYFGVSVDYLLGRDTKEPPLTDDEASLLGSYRGFNGEGKERAREFVTAMQRSGMYAAGTNYFAQ